MGQKFVLGVDLDGVVADFYEGLRPIAAEWLDVPESTLTHDVTYGLPEWHLDAMGGYTRLHHFAVTQRELFRVLKPIGSAPATLRKLAARDDIRIRIITHRLFIKHFQPTPQRRALGEITSEPRSHKARTAGLPLLRQFPDTAPPMPAASLLLGDLTQVPPLAATTEGFAPPAQSSHPHEIYRRELIQRSSRAAFHRISQVMLSPCCCV